MFPSGQSCPGFVITGLGEMMPAKSPAGITAATSWIYKTKSHE